MSLRLPRSWVCFGGEKKNTQDHLALVRDSMDCGVPFLLQRGSPRRSRAHLALVHAEPSQGNRATKKKQKRNGQTGGWVFFHVGPRNMLGVPFGFPPRNRLGVPCGLPLKPPKRGGISSKKRHQPQPLGRSCVALSSRR